MFFSKNLASWLSWDWCWRLRLSTDCWKRDATPLPRPTRPMFGRRWDKTSSQRVEMGQGSVRNRLSSHAGAWLLSLSWWWDKQQQRPSSLVACKAFDFPTGYGGKGKNRNKMFICLKILVAFSKNLLVEKEKWEFYSVTVRANMVVCFFF